MKKSSFVVIVIYCLISPFLITYITEKTNFQIDVFGNETNIYLMAVGCMILAPILVIKDFLMRP